MNIWDHIEQERLDYEGRHGTGGSPTDWVYARLVGMAIVVSREPGPPDDLISDLVALAQDAPSYTDPVPEQAMARLVGNARHLAQVCEMIELEAARRARSLGVSYAKLAVYADVSYDTARNRYRDQPPPP